ncbi:hypothetical protein N0V94_001863 [Neodidymelliopsis sp. IMI 364377]|nr:hypothetical protein N0V94_001863 [Neodidymelliopsis sp. IMI 364377]
MDSVTVRYRALAIENGIPDYEAFEVEQSLLDSHAYLRSWNQGLADRVEYLSKRLQALSQSPGQVYSGIAQRDSANSLSIGRTSTKLAGTSQQVAIATSRDSAVMRVITAVTVVFLPGTFTATFFSTTFFNFGAGTNGHVFSPWIWLYFVLTLALTAIVISGTWVLWRSKEKEITMHLDKHKVETDE